LSASSLLSSGACRYRALLRHHLTTMLLHYLYHLAARSPHHPSTGVLQPRQAKLWPSSHATHLVAALTATAPAACHLCHNASMQAHTRAWVTSLSPPNAPLCLLLHTHMRASFSSAAIAVELPPPPLRTIRAAAKGLNGSTLAPRCSPAQPCHWSCSEPAAA
jgi:hypothetical protein